MVPPGGGFAMSTYVPFRYDGGLCHTIAAMTANTGRMVLCTADPLVVRRLEALAGELGFRLVTPSDAGAAQEGEIVGDVVVIDLDAPGALEEIVRWRESHPEAFVAGHLGRPDSERWTGAERAGCDLVVNRGALVNTLRRRLAGGAAALRRRRVPPLDSGARARRLGLG